MGLYFYFLDCEKMDGLFYALIILGVYFLPTVIAGGRGSVNTGIIFLLNLFLGWTFIVWLICIIWASTSKTKQEAKEESEMRKAFIENMKK